MTGTLRRHYWLGVGLCLAAPVAGQLSQPGVAPARGPDLPQDQPTPTPGATPAPAADPQGNAPIVPDAEFNAALPPLSGDINAPLEPMPAAPVTPLPPAPTTPLPQAAGGAPIATGDTLGPVAPEDPQLAQPLAPLGSFNSVPLETAADVKSKNAPEVRYDVVVKGLDALDLDDDFKAHSALREGKGKAANTTQVRARATEDQALAVRLMKSLGYYDATATATVSQPAPPATVGAASDAAPAGTVVAADATATALAPPAVSTASPAPAVADATTASGATTASAATPTPAPVTEPGRLTATIVAAPGRLYTLSSITVKADPVVPADLITHNLPLKVGDPIEAACVEGAEANVSLQLPQNGYPFVKVGERDILLDDQAPQATGAYTLPVETGPRSSFGRLTTTGDPVFGLDHLNVFPRFDQGQIYDSRLTDDLRDALVATGLFSTVAVEPQRTGRAGPDGTEQVDLLVRQTKGPPRSFGGSAGYATGQGFRVEGTWTHRNLFPPEGALILSAIGGTQEQGASATFRRSNAGRRDRTFSIITSADHSSYDAYSAYTGTLAVRWSYDSTPIWQKKLTYAYGAELVGTNENTFDFDLNDRVRRTYGIVALPAQVIFDRSDNLLNPTRGYRLKLNLSPETSVHGAVRPYARTMVEGDVYFPVSPSLVLAGKVRAGSIFGIARDDIAPSRRYYGGGGGSVRGYGYQRLGPFEPLDPNNPDRDEEKELDPVGGRSLNEFALEARYRFGNFGIVPFLDAGNSYSSSLPSFSDLRYGAGIGGRFYTNFGPLRADIATPLNPRPGDGPIAIYISIGQAF